MREIILTESTSTTFPIMCLLNVFSICKRWEVMKYFSHLLTNICTLLLDWKNMFVIKKSTNYFQNNSFMICLFFVREVVLLDLSRTILKWEIFYREVILQYLHFRINLFWTGKKRTEESDVGQPSVLPQPLVVVLQLKPKIIQTKCETTAINYWSISNCAVSKSPQRYFCLIFKSISEPALLPPLQANANAKHSAQHLWMGCSSQAVELLAGCPAWRCRIAVGNVSFLVATSRLLLERLAFWPVSSVSR